MSEQHEYWEPWQPQVGDRVRFRDSGECRCPECGHLRHVTMDGATRRGCLLLVAAVRALEFEATCSACHGAVSDGHRYFLISDVWGISGMAAAIELELVERAEDPGG